MMRSAPLWFAGLLAVTIVAFWPSYLSKAPADVDRYTHAHAALMTLWFALLIGQPLLIRRGRHDWHRLLGRATLLLVPLIAIVVALLMHARVVALDQAVLASEGKFFFLPFRSIALFLLAYALALARRSAPALHARYMACTAIALIDPVVARLQFFYLPPLPDPLWYSAVGFALSDLALAVLWWLDRASRVRGGPYAVMLGAYLAFDLLWFTLGQTPVWLAVVVWFRALPLTS